MTDSRKPDLKSSFPTLFDNKWPAGGLADKIASVDIDMVCAEHEGLRNAAMIEVDLNVIVIVTERRFSIKISRLPPM